MNKKVLEELERSFKLKARKGLGGKIFKYVPSEDIVDRMNRVFEGEWSTEVIDSEIIEDSVLVCVRVHVKDHQENTIYYHDGYASHPLSRYTGGDNKGKIIDVGNSYRSAVSKAIKTACTRWGVALYLEENETSSGEVISTAVNFAPTFSKTEEIKKVDSDSLDIPTVPINTSAEKKNPEKMERPGLWSGPPEINEMKIEKNVDTADTNPVFTNNTIISSAPVGNMPDIPLNNQSQEEVIESYVENSIEKLTSVQKVAIETVMSVNSMIFDDLVNKALQRQDNLPPTIDDVSYLDAVTIIQYGNHLRPIENY